MTRSRLGREIVREAITLEDEPGHMVSKRHHRCNLCGKDFETGDELKDHIERRHPKADVHWWVVAEEPDRDLRFSRR